MTPTADAEAAVNELTPLADYLGSVLRRLRALPPLDLDLTQAYGNVLAEDVVATHSFPAFDQAAVDGYAACWEDIAGGGRGGYPPAQAGSPGGRVVRLNVVGDLGAASWRPVRLAPGACFSVAAGAPLPIGADVVVPVEWTDQGMAAVEIHRTPKRGYSVRKVGEEIPAGTLLARAGTYVSPALVAVLAATGIGHVVVRPSPRVVIVATGDELVEVGRGSQPGQVVDVNSHGLTAAAAEVGALAYRVGICDDDPEGLRGLLEDQTPRADLIITTGGTGTGPGDMVRRILSRREGNRTGPVTFTEVALYPGTALGFGTVGPEEVPVVCLPGDPGAALIGFEVLARPVINLLAGAEPVFRPGVRAHLLETISSPGGLREFRPAHVAERRGGGYTVQPLRGGPLALSGLAEANGLLVLGERVTTAAAGSTVDVLLLDRRR
ncbi:molybdopterin molybdotransferase MoeA [Salinispora arenicola]|uniref:Molybdopterin molybdenumtransferase n=2 Tax=Salinispora arenicola TaxID=168697 RepID=A0A542XIA4_SALAC|nr:gephyrin-like molybdotransferase Glp [Salinispora arenicola]MCN0152287.1 molybdopterin molybdotransferase MoeA [Salinispora arenicola]MCN0177394.1 molybdopterin molybdotransferase MoeA [Salinispora arenicola]NIL42070.1 molybdopterin molybdotransferase MoeA [Salinispora arenicola]NIL57358.1 molybdopterin molybdotransferase MoeA [Salinispora arenicola]NIL62001.1 molybdopterin molybdotransferase MoeA [Salinispora arenicola]